MTQRLIVIGGVAAGASAAAKARRANEYIEIVLFEAGPYPSFANCGLPYYVGGEIPNRDALFVVDPALFDSRLRVDLRLQHRVTAIDRNARQVSYVDAEGRESTMAYDRLVLATGTEPLVPPVPGIEAANIFTCRTVPDVDAITARLASIGHDNEDRAEVLVIGGGFIGLECAEQLLDRGCRVTLVEMAPQVMGPLDPEMAWPLEEALVAAGGEVITGDAVATIDHGESRSVATLGSGRKIAFDFAVLGTGVKPNVALARAAGLELGVTGAIKVDRQQRTSDPAIFAAGDNAEAEFLPTGTPVNIPLAWPANKQGRVAGCNAAMDLAGVAADDPLRLRSSAITGTSIVRVCGMNAGGTGLTEKVAARLEREVAVVYLGGPNHASYYPGARPMMIKLVYEPASGRVLGAQAYGESVDKRLDVFSTAIRGGLTVEELEDLDLSYAPPFGNAKDAAVLAGFAAANARRGIAPGIGPLDFLAGRGLAENTVLVDVRSAREAEVEPFESALNVPLDELRQRLDEIPQGRPLVVACASGQRSYAAQQILRHHGRGDVRNLYGGYRLLSRVRAMQRR
jgi:NADPH-dependent 2,4-dienoyl-CoA reductase/sulfur reductase-like enzyme/rhodanese-related sulfurtransferase